MAKLAPFGIYQANAGDKLYTYEAGTSTPKDTYTSSDESVVNSNPVVMDSKGFARVWLGVGGYKFVLKDSNDVERFTEDNIDGGGAAGFASSVVERSSGFSLNVGDSGSVNVCTQPITITLLSAATAGDGYSAIIINNSSGNVTIAPDGSDTINGAASYIVSTGGSCIIHTNGVAWFVSAESKNLFDDSKFGIYDSADMTKLMRFDVSGVTTGTTITKTVQNASATLYETGGTDVAVADGGTGASTSADARTNLGITMVGVLNGLTLSNNVSTPNTHLDIAAGFAGSATNGVLMTLASALSKRLDAVWAVGTGNGGLDTGSRAPSTWYHVHLIYNPTSNIVDALFSTSVSSPTMPSGYTERRRIGAILTDGSSNILAFYQNGDEFYWSNPVTNYNTFATTTAAVTQAVSTPLGIVTTAMIRGTSTNSGGAAVYRLFTSLNTADATPSISNANAGGGTNTVDLVSTYSLRVPTNTSSQIRVRSSSTNTGAVFVLLTTGWIDNRGKF